MCFYIFFIALGAWLSGVVMSFAYGNRTLPAIILVLGLALVVLSFMGIAGPLGLVGLCILAIIIWIANKAEMG
jgi:hypothetical protein